MRNRAFCTANGPVTIDRAARERRVVRLFQHIAAHAQQTAMTAMPNPNPAARTAIWTGRVAAIARPRTIMRSPPCRASCSGDGSRPASAGCGSHHDCGAVGVHGRRALPHTRRCLVQLTCGPSASSSGDGSPARAMATRCISHRRAVRRCDDRRGRILPGCAGARRPAGYLRPAATRCSRRP